MEQPVYDTIGMVEFYKESLVRLLDDVGLPPSCISALRVSKDPFRFWVIMYGGNENIVEANIKALLQLQVRYLDTVLEYNKSFWFLDPKNERDKKTIAEIPEDALEVIVG